MSFPYLDLAIALSFIFLLLALTCTTINETIAGIVNSRGKTLEKGIADLLQSSSLKDQFYSHPLIQGLQSTKTGGKRLPSYISSDNFSLVLMDILSGSAGAGTSQGLRQGVAQMQSPARTILTAVLQNARYTTDQERIEAWFEQGMSRVTGWYKRTAQVRVFVLAALVTLLMNADTLKILQTLWNNPTMTAVVIESAKGRLQKGRPDVEALPMVKYDNPDDPTASTPTEIPERDVVSDNERRLLGEVMGWQGDWYDDYPGHENHGYGSWILYLLRKHILGWLITILAVSLGAPFWFDVLNKFMNARNAGKPPDKTTQYPPVQSQTQPQAQPNGGRS